MTELIDPLNKKISLSMVMGPVAAVVKAAGQATQMLSVTKPNAIASNSLTWGITSRADQVDTSLTRKLTQL
ncbi:hypothetical protein RRG08_059836 [Elysia crispata]|uniref:Uncharacterized protein n=1 Tax=Elysia crispata TaxID=231223 RepID=A0AAE1DDY6_9GAST|nr:hypothetical protein RRG08_059836 [Elysia crispata]